MAFASLEQIATVLNMTPQMVNRHVKHHGMPRVSRGQYDLIKCVHWYIAYKDKLIDEARKGKETEGQARQRLVIAEANLKELQYARARGDVVEVEAAKQLWARLVLAFKSKVLLMPSKLPTLVMGRDNPNEVREVIEKEVNEALNELSQARIDTSDIPRPGPFDETGGRIRKPSPKAHRKRVGGQRKGAKPPELRRTGKVEDGPGTVSEGNDGRGDGPKGGDGDSHDSGQNREDGSDQ
jgi:phage terminase Nu1 subunit (DNA packaging protein)